MMDLRGSTWTVIPSGKTPSSFNCLESHWIYFSCHFPICLLRFYFPTLDFWAGCYFDATAILPEMVDATTVVSKCYLKYGAGSSGTTPMHSMGVEMLPKCDVVYQNIVFEVVGNHQKSNQIWWAKCPILPIEWRFYVGITSNAKLLIKYYYLLLKDYEIWGLKDRFSIIERATKILLNWVR